MSEQKTLLTDLLLPNQRVEDSVLCPVCHDIMLNPVSCSKCETDSCQACSSNACKCEAPFNQSHKLLLKLLSGYRFQCLNEPYGCPASLNYESVSGHFIECPFEPKDCPLGCLLKIGRGHIEEHMKICPSRVVICIHCNSSLKARDLERHLKDCPLAPQTCPGCLGPFDRKELTSHVAICELVAESCEFCGGAVVRNNKVSHLKNSCLYTYYIRAVGDIQAEIGRVEDFISFLADRFEEQRRLCRITCGECGLGACEAGLRTCSLCASKQCLKCASGRYAVCHTCKGLMCAKCLSKADLCVQCVLKKKKGDKAVPSIIDAK